MVYLQESENDLSIDNDPVSFTEAINDDNFDKWLDAMKDELESQGLLGLSQKAYINKVLERFRMHKCSTSHVPI